MPRSVQAQLIIHPDEISKKQIDRLCEAGVGRLGIHPVGGKEAARSLEELVKLSETKEYRELIDYAVSRDMKIEYELHAAGYLLPRSLFEQHPEYFRMNEVGERCPDYNLCVSNEDALALLSRNAADLALSLYKSAPSFYFWMDDGRNIHCHCPKCSRLSPSDQQLVALNSMLKEVKKHIPNAKMAYLAYVDTVLPPENTIPEEGIFLEYAPFEKYTAKGDNAPELVARELRMLAPLMDFFGREDCKVLEYWYDNSLFSGWKKPPRRFVLDREGMERDIAQYRELGFECISSFACYLGEDYEALYGKVGFEPFVEVSLR